MLDGLIGEVTVPPPLQGLLEGLDPALSDSIYSPLHAFDLLNFRVTQGLWETRLGQLIWQTLPGSGSVRMLGNFYHSNGQRVRLAARGNTTAGVLYQLIEGTDLTFQSVSGGTGLGSATEPYFQYEILHDVIYLTDRSGALIKWNPNAGGTKATTVVAVTAPAIAPRVRPRYYAILDDFSTIGSTWSQSNTANYELTDSTATVPAPMGLRTAQLQNKNSSAKGNTASENVNNEPLNSHTIAFFINENTAKQDSQFEIGIGAPGEYAYPMKAAADDEWYPVFVNVGDLPTINFKGFRSIRSPGGTQTMWVSSLVLPGKLDGQYRWVYTHYDSTTGRESAPSPVSGNGTPVDLSVIGTTNKLESIRAFSKSAFIDFTSDSGTDASTNKIRIYRSGGVPELTKDSRGKDVWLRVGEVLDYSTTFNANASAAATSFTVPSPTSIAAGDTLVLEKGVSGKEEYVHVLSVTGVGPFTVNLGISGLSTEALQFAHNAAATVQIAFHDNVANEAIDITHAIDIEREGPPTAIRYIRRSTDGRLWAFGFSGSPNGVAVSNRPTPDHAQDYETFPSNVDPQTRRSPNQGWRFQIGGDTTDESVMWGGFFRGQPYVFTRRNLYLIQAQSQLEWGANAIQPVFDVGCICGDTVAEVNGALYWVAPGPRVMRWSGPGSAPELISRVETNQRLFAAPTLYWNQWFGIRHARRDGNYYLLYYTPVGETTNIERLDLNTELGQQPVWEPMRYKNSAGVVVGMAAAAVRDGSADNFELYQASSAGIVYHAEFGLTDDGAPISVRGTTKKFSVGVVALFTKFWLRLAAVSADTLTLTLVTTSSEYGTVTHTYTLNLAGSGEKEIFQRLARDGKGRFVQFTISGSVSNRPAIRDMQAFYLPVRLGRHNL